MAQKQTPNLRMIVYASLFTALMIVGGYISFPLPLGFVPIVLTDFFVMLAGLCLGTAWATASVGLFLFLGALGLPVFAGGKAGLAVFIGPTGGFLGGYLIGVLLSSLISSNEKPSLIKDLSALIIANIAIFGLGLLWLRFVLHTTYGKAMIIGLFPFIPGNIIKIIAAMLIIPVIRPFLKPSS